MKSYRVYIQPIYNFVVSHKTKTKIIDFFYFLAANLKIVKLFALFPMTPYQSTMFKLDLFKQFYKIAWTTFLLKGRKSS